MAADFLSQAVVLRWVTREVEEDDGEGGCCLVGISGVCELNLDTSKWLERMFGQVSGLTRCQQKLCLGPELYQWHLLASLRVCRIDDEGEDVVLCLLDAFRSFLDKDADLLKHLSAVVKLLRVEKFVQIQFRKAWRLDVSTVPALELL